MPTDPLLSINVHILSHKIPPIVSRLRPLCVPPAGKCGSVSARVTYSSIQVPVWFKIPWLSYQQCKLKQVTIKLKECVFTTADNLRNIKYNRNNVTICICKFYS